MAPLRQRKTSPVVSIFFGFATLIGIALNAQTAAATNGHVLHGIGPSNQALGGAGAAFATDVVSALHWNPATVGRLASRRVDFSMEYFVPDRTVESSIDANAFGVGVPGVDLSGSAQSDTNAAVLPSIGAHYRLNDSKSSFSFALAGLAGFGVEYDSESPPAPGSNPLLSNQPPAGLGFGKIVSNYELATMNAGFAHEISPRIRIGLVAVAAFSRLKIKPALFAAPDDANGDTFGTYPGSDGHDEAFGGGFRLGVQVEPIDGLFLGLSYSSPIWFEEFKWSTVDELGNRRQLNFGLDFPQQVNAGISYSFTEDTRLETDIRWIDYEHTAGFRRDGYAPSGAVRGFGWKSILVVAVGLEQKVGSRGTLRIGYNYGENPIPSSRSFFNVPAPAIVEHHLTAGFSFEVSPRVELHASYYHGFKNTDEGPMVLPSGAVAGTRVKNELSEHSVNIGLTLRLGDRD